MVPNVIVKLTFKRRCYLEYLTSVRLGLILMQRKVTTLLQYLVLAFVHREG